MASSTGLEANFLQLPAEIRWMIYEQALSGSRVAVGWSGSWDFGRRELERTPFALLRTCKRVYADMVNAWPQWCVIDLGPLRRYNSVKILDVLSLVPTATLKNIQTLCVPAFHIQVFRASPLPDQLYNGFSFFSIFQHLNLTRLLLRWDDTISSPSSPQNHDYQYGVIREQIVQYGTGWKELYLATPFKEIVNGLDFEIKKRDGIDSGASATLHLVQRDKYGALDTDSELRSIYDAVAGPSCKGEAHVIVVKRGKDVNIHEPPATTPVINDPHTQIQWFRGSNHQSDSSSFNALRQSFILEPSRS